MITCITRLSQLSEGLPGFYAGFRIERLPPGERVAVSFRIFSTALAAFFIIAGCSDYTTEELHKEGLKLLDENNPRGAIVLFKNALQRDQNLVEARFQLAQAYYRIADFDSAEKELRKVIRQSPSSGDARIALARVYLQKARPDDALKALNSLGEDAPDNADAFELAGLAYAAKGEYSLAADSLKKAVSIDNGRTTAGIALASVYSEAGDVEKARALINQVLKTAPLNKRALFLLAGIHMSTHDFEGAAEVYDHILQNYPLDAEALVKKGLLSIELGRTDEALAISDTIIREYPDHFEGYRIKGIAHFRRKEFGEAILSFQKLLSIRPDAVGYYYLGLCHFYRNELEQSISQFYRALDLNPSFVQARLLIGIIFIQQDRVDDAITEAKRATGLAEGNGIAHSILGTAYLAKGMFDEGLEELNKAAEIDPRLFEDKKKDVPSGGEELHAALEATVAAAPAMFSLRINLASHYTSQKEYIKALETLNDGLTGRKTDAILYNLIAEVLLQQNNIAGAAEFLQKAKDINPDYYTSYLRLASLHLYRGEHEKAVLELKTVIERSAGNLEALLRIAYIYEMSGQNEEAHDYYVKAETTGKAGGYIALAKFYLRQGAPEKAIEVLHRGIEKNPSETTLHELKGRIYLLSNKFPEALKCFEDIEKLAPEQGLIYVVNAYIFMNRPEDALKKLRKALAGNPERLELMAEISRIYSNMGRKASAVEYARQIIRKRPGSPVGYMALARIFHANKETGRAIQVLEKASVEEREKAGIYSLLGSIYTSIKDYPLAFENYRKAEKVNSSYVPAIFGQGAVLYAMGFKEESMELYKRTLRISRNYLPALNSLAYLYAEYDRDLAAALQLAIRAYNLAPDDGNVLDTLGFVLLKSGRTEEALKVLRKAVEVKKDDPSIHYHISLAYHERGDEPLAIQSLQKSLNLGPFPDEDKARALLDKLRGKNGV